MKNILLSFLVVFLSQNISLGQVLTDSTVAMIAFWEKGDVAKYECSEKIEKLSKGERSIEETNYDMEMTILDSTETSYTIRQDFKNVEYKHELKSYEKKLMEECLEIPIVYRTDEMGAFESLQNTGEIRTFSEKAVQTILDDFPELPDSIRQALSDSFLSMFETDQQLNFWAADIKNFHEVYSWLLYRNETMEFEKYYSNPFMEMLMPGFQTIRVVTVDEENGIAKIAVESGLEENHSKRLMYDFAVNMAEKMGVKEIDEYKADEWPGFAVQESKTYVYNMDSGYILKYQYTKRTKLNKDYKITMLNCKLKNVRPK